MLKDRDLYSTTKYISSPKMSQSIKYLHHRYVSRCPVDLDSIDIQLAFIVLAGIAASCYFLFLLTMVVRVFRNILAKKSVLPNMSKPRRNFYLVSPCFT